MTYCVFILDTISLKHIEHFWHNNMAGQNRIEDIKQWIGGEYYIQTSLYNSIKNKDFCRVICIDTPFDKDILLHAAFIISPGWATIPNEFRQYKSKMFTYRYFETSCDDFPSNRIFTPFKYTGGNIFLPLTTIPLADHEMTGKRYNSNGLLVGKCVSHVVAKNKHTNLLEFINNLSYPILSVLRPLHMFEKMPDYLSQYKDICKEYSEKIINHKNIKHVGILNPKEFRSVLSSCKYCIFFHGAFSPPTLLECLTTQCIIISTRDVIPSDLLDNPNIILMDDISFVEIYSIITDIETGTRRFDTTYSSDYTDENKLAIIQSYLK